MIFMGVSKSTETFATLMASTVRPKSPDRGGGVDALIGRTQSTSDGVPRLDGRQRYWHRQQKTWVDFRMTDFVRMLGGEYFFIPSMTFLNYIHRDVAGTTAKAAGKDKPKTSAKSKKRAARK